MKSIKTQGILIFPKLDALVQTSLVFAYVVSLIVSHCGVKYWLNSQKSKKSKSMNSYIANLEWYRLMEDSKDVL